MASRKNQGQDGIRSEKVLHRQMDNGVVDDKGNGISLA